MTSYYKPNKTWTSANTVAVISTTKTNSDVAPEIEKTTRKLSDEDISIMAPLIENLLQDSLVYCTEECCEDAVEESSVEELAILVIKTLFQEYIFPTKDVQELLDQNMALQKKIVKAQSQIKSLESNVLNRKEHYEEKMKPHKHSQFGPIHKESKKK